MDLPLAVIYATFHIHVNLPNEMEIAILPCHPPPYDPVGTGRSLTY